MAGEIIVGYDGSSCAKAALGEAATLAKALGTSVVVVFGYEVWAVGGETSDHKAIVHGMGERAVEEALFTLQQAGVHGESAVIAKRPWEALLELAAEREARMIVVGHHGEGPIRGAILGSVPYKLLPQAEVPVLIVPGE